MSGTLLTPLLAAGRRSPGTVAVRAADATLTWAELIDLAGRYAAGYRRHGVRPGDRVAVLLEPGAHAVAAAVAAFGTGAAFVPLDPRQPESRTADLLHGTRPRVVVADAAGPGDRLTPAEAGRLPVAELSDGSPADVAYVVHTSGSTGRPKAVQVEHRNVLNLFADLDTRAPVPDGCTGTWWTRPTFDVAVLEAFTPLLRGGTVAVVPAEARHDGAALAAFLDRSGAQSAYVPPAFLPDLLALLRAAPGSLSRLRRLLVGVEPIPRLLLQEIARSRPELTVLNGYGPAEATICCTLYVVPREGAAPGERTPIGTAVRGNTLYLRRPDGSYRRTGTGELVVAGANVTRGYLHDDGGSPAFQPDPVAGDGARAYRTGDLVRTLPDGNLLFLGRVDRQLKVRGFRVEPGEVEAVLRELPGVREAVVAGRDLDGLGAVLVAFVVPEAGAELTDRAVRDHAADRLPAHAVPAAVVFLPRMPLTAHGKYDHERLAAWPVPTVAPEPPDVHGDLLATVLGVWRRLLRLPDVRPDDSFLDLGGTSVAAGHAAATLRERTGRPVSAGDVLTARSAAELAERLGERVTDRVDPATPDGRGATTAPLSPEQLGLWLHDEMRPEAGLYVEPVCFETDLPVDRDLLVDALRRAVSAHPAFGAGLDLADGLPVLALGRHEPPVEVVDVPDDAALDAAVRDRSRRPFDTAAEPLLRVAVLARGERTVLLPVWHHLVVDAWSLRLFLADLRRCYDEPGWRPAPASATICDLARRRTAFAESDAGRAAVDAALARLAGAPVPDRIPAPGGPDRVVLTREVRVPADVLAATAQAAGATRTELAAAAYARGLGQVFGLDEVVVGLAATTRCAADEFAVAGYAVNTVLLRCRDLRDDSWPATLRRVRDELRRAVAEQAPFRDVARQLLRGSGAPPGSFPSCYLDPVEEPALVTGTVTWRRRPLPRPANRFPLCLTVHERPDGLAILLEAESRLLTPDAAEALATAVTGHLEAATLGRVS